MAGLEQPTTGSLTWPGLALRPDRPTPAAAQLGLVFQGPSLLAPLDVRENVAFPLLLAGMGESDARSRTDDALDLVGVGDLAAKLPEELSGGQSQRVAIARVVAMRPSLILADEPTGQLDHETAAHVLDVLTAAADAIGAAMVVTTHDPIVARRFATRWTMRDGRLTSPRGRWQRDPPLAPRPAPHRRGRILAAAVGTATAVALLACLGSFLAASKATMTQRAAGSVAVDWQVQVAAGADPSAVDAIVGDDPATVETAVVDFAATTGLSATTGGTTQTTGPGRVVGIPADYASRFPGEIRALTGDGTGVLLAQQTAANLHAGAGDEVTIGLAGRAPVTVRVDGVVDLPQADSLFQTVGAPPGAAASAPPDNVIVLPADVYAAQVAPRPRPARTC